MNCSVKGGCWGGKHTRRHKRVRGGAVEPGFTGTIGTAGAIWTGTSTATPYSSATGAAIPDIYSGGRRKGMSVKAMKRALKKAGLKTTGKKAALTRRLKKAHLKMKGGSAQISSAPVYGAFTGEGTAGLIGLTAGSQPQNVGVQSA